MPPNGFFTVSLLVTDVTPGTPLAIASALPIWAASVTVPFNVTAPSFAMTLMSPALPRASERINLHWSRKWPRTANNSSRDLTASMAVAGCEAAVATATFRTTASRPEAVSQGFFEGIAVRTAGKPLADAPPVPIG